MKTGKAKAFTLIELLVVIAIIVILVSLLLPALREAKRTVYKVNCMSNMKQVGTATQLYTVDHRGLIPPGGFWEGGNRATFATNKDGSYIVIGKRARGGGNRVPVVGIQHLLKMNDYISKYLWCQDMTVQDAIERLYPHPNDTGPAYATARDLVQHTGGVRYWNRSSYKDDALSKCIHLLNISSVKPTHLMLGEIFDYARYVGYNVPSESNYYPYAYQGVALRHSGYIANFLMMDNHIESLDRNKWNGKYSEIANEYMANPTVIHP